MFPATRLRLAIPAMAAAFLSTAAGLLSTSALAQPLALNDHNPFGRQIFRDQIFRDAAREPAPSVEIEEDASPNTPVPDRFRRQIVAYNTHEPPGTVIIDTPNTYLYYVLGGGRAIRYGIGVGRDGFTWAGTQSISRKQEWPDWHPPAEMIARQPYLPRFMAGGPGNPLGARALYLGNSLYRIHGTNAPNTIGQRVSSGCIRLTNENVIDLASRVTVGAKVVVLPDHGRRYPVASSEPRERVTHTRTPQRTGYRDARAQAAPAETTAASETPRPQYLPQYTRSSIYTGSSASMLY